MTFCESCKVELKNSKYGSGRFCSSPCARKFSTSSEREEINLKISNSLKDRRLTLAERKNRRTTKYVVRQCSKCASEFECQLASTKKYCSKRCAAAMTQIKLARDGRHNGFPSRENRAPSWAESFVISFLQKNKIRFEREYKINRYFADFAFIDQRVILEIDGKQHLERREKDRQKDETLIKNGWNVIRIPWIHRDPIMMNEKLVNFVETYIT